MSETKVGIIIVIIISPIIFYYARETADYLTAKTTYGVHYPVQEANSTRATKVLEEIRDELRELNKTLKDESNES